MSRYPNLFKIINRMVCTIVYSFPFLELYLFFNPFMRSYRISPAWLESAAIVFRQNPWVSYGLFAIIIYATTSKSLKLNYYSRYNLVQALILMFLSSVLDTMDYLFPYVVRGQGSITAPFFFFLCFSLLVLISYCAIYAIIGKIPNIPLITTAVKIQIEDGRRDSD
jgi:hypothetical protein